MITPVLRQRDRPLVPRLEELTNAARCTIRDADVVRVRRGNAADVWELTVRDSEACVVGETLFTLPLSVTRWEDVAGRVFSFLAAVDLAPDCAWEQVRPGRIRGPIRTAA